MFIEGEMIIINQNAVKGLPHRIGSRGIIVENLHNSPHYAYKIEFDDSTTAKVKESEINKLTPEDIEWMSFIFTGNKVKFGEETAKVIQVDYINKQAGILFKDEDSFTTAFSSLSSVEMEIDIVSEFKFNEGDKVKANTKSMLDGLIGKVRSQVLTDTGKKHYKVVSNDGIYYFDEEELELFEELPFYESKLNLTFYEELLNTFFDHYKNPDNTYTVPKQLLINLITEIYQEVE